MNENKLIIEKAAIGYDQPILNDLSVEFAPGTLTGIIGNNGKGKTTLLKTVCGLQLPLSGHVLFNKSNIHQASAHQRARIFGMTFSSGYVGFPVTVRELVSMGRYPYLNHWATLSAEDLRIVEETMDRCGIRFLEDKPITGLSDGERQKAFIAKLLAQRAPVMLLDEPTAFLDYRSKKDFFHLMKEIAATGTIVIVSSHDIEFLCSFADNLVMLNDEGDITQGKVIEITNTPYFQTHFTHS